MMSALLLILFSVVPVELIARDKCDVLLYEKVYDGDGKIVFIQVCPLDWNPNAERYDYVCWRLDNLQRLRPQRDWRRGGYIVRFADGEIVREIRAVSMRDAWVQEDSELAAREVWPKENRRGLINIGAVPCPSPTR